MMQSLRLKADIGFSQVVYAVFASALIYATAGATEVWRISSFHLVVGAEHALALLAAGLAPLAVIALFLALNRGKLGAGERRACFVGAALTSLILLPLLRLVF